MNRQYILESIVKSIHKLQANFPLYEVVLTPETHPEIIVTRSLFVEGAPSSEEICDRFNQNGYNLQPKDIQRYNDENEVMSSLRFPLHLGSLSLNWRGRFIQWQMVLRSANFADLTRHSYLRLLITKSGASYFTRYEMSPSFYTPPYSTVGREDCLGDIKHYVDFLTRMLDQNEIDAHSDFCSIFYREEPSLTFIRQTPDFFAGENYILASKLVEMSRDGQDVAQLIKNKILNPTPAQP